MRFVNKISILIFMTCLVFVGQAFAVEKWTDEAEEPTDKDEKGFYLVSKPGQLAWFAKESIGKNVAYKIKLVADLDLKGKLWLPIATGYTGSGFSGQFDGDGHTIKNLYIRAEELLEEYTLLKKVNNVDKNCIVQNIGFIGINGGGSIKNLNLENIEIYAKNDQSGCGNEISVGGLVGWKTTSVSDIENVVVSGQIYTSGKGQGVGGIVGNAHSSRISKSVSMVNITADGDEAFVGGIVGLVKNKEVKIDSCVYAGEDLESNGNGGARGAVVGKVYNAVNNDGANAKMTDVYYDSDIPGINAVGQVVSPAKTTGTPSPVSDLNTEEVVCMLNKETLDENGNCNKQEPWSVGNNNISFQGSDGYKVVFDANGGLFPAEAKTSKMLSSGNAITADEISEPSKDGCSFAGWSLEKGASEPSSLGTITKATRVYAVWYPLMTVTFDATDGYFPPETPVVKTKTKKIAKNEPLTVEGLGSLPESFCSVNSEETGCGEMKYFAGWSFNKNATAAEIVDLNEMNTFVTQNTTLYAIWTTEEIYTVTFHADGHGKTKVAFVKVKAGRTVEEMGAVPDVGYVFGGWFTEDGTAFDFKKTEITRSIILNAHWTPQEYTITYELDGGTNPSSNPTKYTIESETYKFEDPSKEGYRFVQWCYDEDCSEPASQITQGVTTGNKTLYAQWDLKTYTIKYLSGKSVNGTTPSDGKDYGESITLKGAVDAFKRSGYTQDGWSTRDGGKWVYALGATYSANANVTLYPHWVEGDVEVSSYGALTIYTYAADDVRAVINGDYTGSEAVEISSGIEVNSVTLDRTFNVGVISTLYVPFNIAIDNIGGATVYKFKTIVKSDVDGRWKFKVSTAETVEANTPYIVMPSNSQVTFDIAESVTINTTNKNYPSESQWTFKGTYEYISFAETSDEAFYVFAGQNIGGTKLGEFVKSSGYANPMRAYLVYNKNFSAAKSINGRLGGGITLPDEIDIEVENENGIVVETGKLNTVTGAVRMDCWFDLKGRRLNSKPTVKGTYYKDGKRVIIK